MKTVLNIFAFALLLCAAALPLYAQTSIREQVEVVMAGNIHSSEEQARYPMRQPAEVLEFFGLESDMRVIELLPFGGWYTKLLSQILKDEGKLYVTQPEIGRYSEMMRDMLAMPGLEAVSEIDWGAEPQGDSPWIASGSWDVEPVDMILTFQNYHNFGDEARATINQSIFDALKAGGYYGIVDHTRRHMQTDARFNGRRSDPVMVIKEVQDTGFELVDYSNLLHRPDDDLTLEVGQPEVSGNSDRFVLLFRKP